MKACINSIRGHDGQRAGKWRAVVIMGSTEIFSSEWYGSCFEAMCEAIDFYKAIAVNHP